MGATHIADNVETSVRASNADIEARRIKDELLRECVEQDVIRPIPVEQNKQICNNP